jgi:hypothetical protein
MDNLKRHEKLTCSERPTTSIASDDTEMDEEEGEEEEEEEEDKDSDSSVHNSSKRDTLGDISDYHSNNSDEEREKMSGKETQMWESILTEADLPNLVAVDESVTEIWRDDVKLLKVIRRLANVVHRLESKVTHLKEGIIYPNIAKDRMAMRKKGYSYAEATLSAWEKRKYLVADLLKRNQELLNDLYFEDEEEEKSQMV